MMGERKGLGTHIYINKEASEITIGEGTGICGLAGVVPIFDHTVVRI